MARYKNVEQYLHTETVYYEDGVEVARVENYDSHWYDTEFENLDVTQDEIDDYYGE